MLVNVNCALPTWVSKKFLTLFDNCLTKSSMLGTYAHQQTASAFALLFIIIIESHLYVNLINSSRRS